MQFGIFTTLNLLLVQASCMHIISLPSCELFTAILLSTRAMPSLIGFSSQHLSLKNNLIRDKKPLYNTISEGCISRNLS